MIFMKDTISQVLPYKNLMEKDKLPNCASQRLLIQVMEMTLFEACNEFMKGYPNVNVQR